MADVARVQPLIDDINLQLSLVEASESCDKALREAEALRAARGRDKTNHLALIGVLEQDALEQDRDLRPSRWWSSRAWSLLLL